MSDDDRRASATIIRIVNRWFDADGDGGAEYLAREILTALRGHGWRPTPATKPHPWQPPTGTGTPPSPAYLAAKQALGRSHQ